VIIRTVEYVGTLATPQGDVPANLPQVAFSGRSNVGKSSLINVLLRRTRSHIARVSSTPGKTQAINFYQVNDRFLLADLPGFGYARVPKTLRDQWKGLIEGYLERSAGLKGVVHLIDSRRTPADLDLEMMDYLARIEVPTLVVVTKMDKLKSSERRKALENARTVLGLDAEQMLPFSAKTGEGRDTLLAALDALLDAADDTVASEAEADEVEAS
jgi:GTP-binding protein